MRIEASVNVRVTITSPGQAKFLSGKSSGPGNPERGVMIKHRLNERLGKMLPVKMQVTRDRTEKTHGLYCSLMVSGTRLPGW